MREADSTLPREGQPTASDINLLRTVGFQDAYAAWFYKNYIIVIALGMSVSAADWFPNLSQMESIE